MTLRELLNIEVPIVQAPMAGVQGSALAIAVSDAGGLGSLPCAMLNADAMRSELQTIAARPICCARKRRRVQCIGRRSKARRCAIRR